MPWSIRHTAVYHSLDLETGKAFWIIVKGDELIKERIRDSVGSSRIPKQVDELDSKGNAFATSLDTHMVICDWCSEHWRWYISYLEEMLRKKTGLSLAVMLDSPQSPGTEKSRKVATTSTLLHAFSEKRGWSNSTLKTSPTSPKQSLNSSTGPFIGPPPPPDSPLCSNALHSSQMQPVVSNHYSFTDFQEVQLTAERVNEVLLVLESNISVLTKVQEHYHTVSQSEHWPKELHHDRRIWLGRFEKRITSIINDLQTQQSRATTLLRLVTDRKALVCVMASKHLVSGKLMFCSCQRFSGSRT
jgi:hypothetical protein